MGVRKGDEVITPPNSFVASTAVIVHLGAKPVFVDVNKDQNINVELIEKKITKKTKAIMPVIWAGRPCELDKIKTLLIKHLKRASGGPFIYRFFLEASGFGSLGPSF